jgi:beta-1,4-mannosyltransferase
MKVLIMSDRLSGNPYLQLLVASLQTAGLVVHSARPARFIFWQAVIEHGRPDVIHLQWQHAYFIRGSLPLAILRTILFFLQWLTLRVFGIRFVWTVHNITNHEKHKYGWELFACRVLARVVDGIIVHGPGAVPLVARAYGIDPKRISVVPHGHYAGWYPPGLTKKEARGTLKLPVEPRIFLFFGYVRAYKGLERLLDTFAAFGSEDVRLILLGKPQSVDLGQVLSAQAAADWRVETHFEFTTPDKLITYISACDLVVLPYEDSLTSGAAILAASCGRAVLVPQIGCLGDFPPEAAIFYDPEMANGLERALDQAMSAPLETMGAAAKTYIEQFPWSVVASKTVALYRSVLGIPQISSEVSSRVEASFVGKTRRTQFLQ